MQRRRKPLSPLAQWGGIEHECLSSPPPPPPLLQSNRLFVRTDDATFFRRRPSVMWAFFLSAFLYTPASGNPIRSKMLENILGTFSSSSLWVPNQAATKCGSSTKNLPALPYVHHAFLLSRIAACAARNLPLPSPHDFSHFYRARVASSSSYQELRQGYFCSIHCRPAERRRRGGGGHYLRHRLQERRPSLLALPPPPSFTRRIEKYPKAAYPLRRPPRPAFVHQ